MSRDASLQVIDADQPSQWEEAAQELLDAITDGQHYRKKRRTIIALADAAYGNRSQASVFTLASCASKVAHYKWRENDPAYEAAYQFLIGDVAKPGLARKQRELEIDEQEQLAISALAEARATLRIHSAEAAHTLVEALSARTSHGPKWHERISAANSILDRSDQETASRAAPPIAIIDNAIMKVYSDEDKVNEQASLPANTNDQEPTSELENPTSERDAPYHEEHEANMRTSTPDRDSKAALLALDSYITKSKSEE